MHSDQFKPKSYVKLIEKYVFSEGEQVSFKCDRIAKIILAMHRRCQGTNVGK